MLSATTYTIVGFLNKIVVVAVNVVIWFVASSSAVVPSFDRLLHAKISTTAFDVP